MPTYDYLCKTCGDEFEADQKITEDPLKTHIPIETGKPCGPVVRLLSPVGHSWKGGAPTPKTYR
jgi:putative FmdB family regulatory protein